MNSGLTGGTGIFAGTLLMQNIEEEGDLRRPGMGSSIVPFAWE